MSSEALANREGVVVWLTGLPSSGKSTLAWSVASRLKSQGRPCLVLDGDEVRSALRPAPGYEETARDAFYETLARMAALVARQGLVTLVPATANLRAYRTRAREIADRLVEVFVDTPIEECERRDAKGLYAKARAGEATNLPGVNAVFEAPEEPDLIVTPASTDAVSLVFEVLRLS